MAGAALGTARLSNEFAVVGDRAHSMVHGEFEPTVPAGTYTDDQLNNVFPSEGITVERNADGTVTLVIPLVDAFGNPDILTQVGEGPILQSLGEHEYKNDEQFDNSLRSVLFQVPKPHGTTPANCGSPVILPSCFTDVSDLAADDIQRSRDHGMPSYNDLRKAYGLAPVQSFTQITGESTDQFPTNDPKIDSTDPLDDPKPRVCGRSTGVSTRSTRSSAWSRRSTCRARSSAPCSSRSGRSSSRRCVTAIGSSTSTIPS
jgi:peroxidase